jgi:hypothetical protein
MLETGIRMLKMRHIMEANDDGLHRANLNEQLLLEYYANSIAHIVKAVRAGEGAEGAGHVERQGAS